MSIGKIYLIGLVYMLLLAPPKASRIIVCVFFGSLLGAAIVAMVTG